MATVVQRTFLSEDDERELAEKLKDGMDGAGTNENVIMEVLLSHTNEQRQKIAAAYEQAMGKPLVDDLKSELSGDLEAVLTGLLMPAREYDAYQLHEAVCGSTDEYTLIGIMCSRSNEELEEIKEIYKTKFECDLCEDLDCDTSGYFGRMMHSLSVGARQDDDDDDKASELAQKLFDAGVNKWGTDECDFNQVLCLSSHKMLRKVFRIYERELRGGDATLEDDISSETSGDTCEGYLSIVKVAKDKSAFFAERIKKCFDGLGTSDDELIRLIISRAETDLEEVKEKYQEKNDVSLFDHIVSECGGYYKRALLSLVQGEYVPPMDE